MSDEQHCMSDDKNVIDGLDKLKLTDKTIKKNSKNPKIVKIHKDKLFEKERIETLQKLFDILEINFQEGKNGVTAIKLEDKKDIILELIENIQKYYPNKMWLDIQQIKLHPHMSIIRHILKYHNYCLLKKGFVEKKDNITKYYKYFIVKTE